MRACFPEVLIEKKSVAMGNLQVPVLVALAMAALAFFVSVAFVTSRRKAK